MPTNVPSTRPRRCPLSSGWSSAWLIAAVLMGPMATAMAADPPASAQGFSVPDGFQVTRFAGDDLAHNIYSMTFDSAGHVVVSGPGYIRRLVDRDGDGRADESVELAQKPASGAQGLLFAGSRMLATGDGQLWCWTDHDGDGAAENPPEAWIALRHPEHGAHAIRQGPDGWFYVICGNDTGVTADVINSPESPVRQPESGTLLRISPDGAERQCVAHGFRNPYDFDFYPTGAIFTVDSDGERDQHLPWYIPTRLFDVGQAAHHGWIFQGWTQSWSRPGYFPDSVPPVATFGRGSPTGLVVYRHHAFPQRYHGAVFTACWTLGRVYAVPLRTSGDTFEGPVEVFLQTTGDVGFAPVDLEVGPEGNLWVAIGGRGTQGGVFCIAPVEKGSGPRAEAPVTSVLAAPQPLAAWSRARWMPQARSLERRTWLDAAGDPTRSLDQRIRAVEVLVELHGDLSADEARHLLYNAPGRLAARVAWALERCGTRGAVALLGELAQSADPIPARAAWEALATLPAERDTTQTALPPLHASLAWNTSSRRVRRAQIDAILRWQRTPSSARSPATGALNQAWLAVSQDATKHQEEYHAIWEQFLIPTLERTPLGRPGSRQRWLESLRLMQLSLGDIDVTSNRPDQAVGYSVTELWLPDDTRRRVAQTLADALPSADEPLDLEIVRTLAILRADDVDEQLDRITEWLSEQISPERMLHGLMAISQIPGTRSAHHTQRTADALVRLHPRMRALEKYPSRNWLPRLELTIQRLVQLDPALPEAIVEHSELKRPEHAELVSCFPAPKRHHAAQRLIEANPEYDDWPAPLVRLVADLPDGQGRSWLRRLWDSTLHPDLIARLLARQAEPEDRDRLLAGLASADAEVVSACAEALAAMVPVDSEDALVPLWIALQRYATDGKSGASQALADLCQAWFQLEPVAARDARGALERLADEFPGLARSVSGLPEATWEDWQQRLAAAPWSAGTVEAGERLFTQRSCRACHVAAGRMGPDLKGIAQRMTRDDLFRAIILPNEFVSPTYQVAEVVLASGRVYHGLLVYESPEGVLLQTSADNTTRIAGEEILSIRPSVRSLMPTGLLDGLSDSQLADLYAYLKTL